RQRQLFSATVGRVTALAPDERASNTLPPPTPEPRQRVLDERAALAQTMSDEVDIESLLLTDDGLSFRRPGVGLDVVMRLRRGHWAIQAESDLHGLRRDEARDQLAAFVRSAAQRGLRCLRVVHGKGLGSPGKQPVLKAKVQRWLGQSAEVIAFTQASGPLGGAGALIVLLVGSNAQRPTSAQPQPPQSLSLSAPPPRPPPPPPPQPSRAKAPAAPSQRRAPPSGGSER
ncbi:MAG: Smr/MutS family protein, partial [Pseudomonadota bacterium]|nr:Smr/MutS family protein [Pseudomonadota bacterium]